ncbi:transmembrane protein 237-like isoform X1 [Schistocerca cancellata]|uniref:transmembrane protein 237-like isoform X1 n=1 Tax=Schistocerca cancellata TaxID=274614 RepID=UPI002118574F|nr:transmembrane protein 237-like isoform X1 [Schistocerca cancellata]XP_049777033.1 transmembrane protein 237-like isoform X1 [Schistocerca cancellata]XP_049777034.1 transmembrane protein 237-like isoform X1 [Schistocerca cancellata]XP_049777035.1 transmembrane protein 237-like isoform X1 [Schistocerca cancellata]
MNSDNEESVEGEKRTENKRKRRRKKDKAADTVVTAALKQLNADEIETVTADRVDGVEHSVTTQPVFRSYPSDMVYVERKSGFLPAPREIVLSRTSKIKFKEKKLHTENKSTVELAVKIQEAFHPFYNLCHGILGGMSLTLCLLVVSIGWNRVEIEEFINVYDNFSRPVQSMFYFLTVVCVISSLDRCDVAQMCGLHARKLCLHHFPDILLLLLYLCTLVTTVVTSYWDEQLAYHHHNTTGTWKDDADMKASLSLWRNLHFGRCIGAVSSWIIVSLYPDHGLLHSRLISTIKLQFRPAVDITSS